MKSRGEVAAEGKEKSTIDRVSRCLSGKLIAFLSICSKFHQLVYALQKTNLRGSRLVFLVGEKENIENKTNGKRENFMRKISEDASK